MTEDKLKSLKDYTGEDEIISSHELKLKLDATQGKMYVQVKSGLPSLDHAIEGFQDGELIVISGPTKQGKTLLAQTFTYNFYQKNIHPLWFTFEVPPKQFLSQFPDLPLMYMPTKLRPYAMDWLEDRIMESFLKNNTRIVFIDHLHFLFDMARLRSPSIEIGTVIRKLKTIAINNNFVIFLLCHTTKGKSEQTLSYESIRDSSFISQESDSVLMIKRTDGVGADLRVEFHRRTGALEKLIHLEKKHGYLVELTQRENYTDI